MVRVTRSSANKTAEPPAKKPVEAKKKVEKTAKPAKEPPAKKETKKKAPPAKKGAAVAEEKKAEEKPEEVPEKEPEAPAEKKVVAVEASKQCAAFNTRAMTIVKAVGDLAVVKIDKVAKGNFVVRVEGIDEPIVFLEGMARPFPALKALDMEEVAKKVLEALNA